MNQNKLTNGYQYRDYIEIERKFLLEDINIDEIANLINNYGVAIKKKKSITQIDIYYDTKEKYFYNNNISCRVRKRDNKLYATVKMPAGKYNHIEKFEYEFKICNCDIFTIASAMKEYVDENIYNKILESNKVLEVKNNRITLEGIQNDVRYEIAYDRVTYNNSKGKPIFQDIELEIELKSNYDHKEYLDELAYYLLENTKELVINKKSKYKRGMEQIEKQ